MAKNVTIAGAAYSAVPSIDVPQTGGGTASFFDVSDTTATAADVAQGKDFYAADGTKTTGTASGGGGDTDPYPVRNDGKTHLWVEVDDTTNMTVTIAFNTIYSPGVIVDWGDGVISNNSSKRASHTYTLTGLYEIVIARNGTGGANWKFATATYGIMYSNTANAGRLVAAEISGLTDVSTNNYLTSTFVKCSNLRKVTMRGITNAGANLFRNGADSIMHIDFGTAGGILGASYADKTTLRVANAAQANFTGLAASCFSGCTHLQSFFVPITVTEIRDNAFYNCSNLRALYCKPTTPPTLGTDALTGTPSDMVIYVPTGSLADYQAAENWSTYASQMVEE